MLEKETRKREMSAQVAFHLHLSCWWTESERSCSSGSKETVFTLHLRSRLFIYGLHCERLNWNFPPKELPTCERKTETTRVVSGYELGVMCNFSD